MIASITPASGAASLAELQDKHAQLVKEVGKDLLTPASLARIVQFVHTSIATGAVLDDPSDRAAAQSLIAYWVVRLANVARQSKREARSIEVPEFEDTLLEEFDPQKLVAAVIEPTDLWLKNLNEKERTLARRIMLRLVRLREDDKTWEVRPSTSDWLLERLEPREAEDDSSVEESAKHILAELVRRGVIRTIRNSSGLEDYALGSPELLIRWPQFQGWMEERKRFRVDANVWAQRRVEKEKTKRHGQPLKERVWENLTLAVQKFGGWTISLARKFRAYLRPAPSSEDSVSVHELEEAETYRDRSKNEHKMIYEKLDAAKDNIERHRKYTGVAVVVAVFCLLLFTVASVGFGLAWVRKIDLEIKEKKLTKNTLELEEKNSELAEAQNEADFLKRKAQYYFLQYFALQSSNTDWRQGLLYDIESLKVVEKKNVNKYDYNNPKLAELRERSTTRFRSILANFPGRSFYAKASVGASIQIALNEREQDGQLRWVAVAGDQGLITLWDFADMKRPKQEVLRFGFAPPIQTMFFTDDGSRLVVFNARNSISVLNLAGDKKWRLVDCSQFPDKLTSLYVNRDRKWLEVDDYLSKGYFVDLGGKADESPRQFSFNLDRNAFLPGTGQFRYFSFSKDSQWFVRITDAGEVFLWDLKAPKNDPNSFLPIKLTHSPIAKNFPQQVAVNGEFLNDNSRLVVYFSNGTVRYWDLKDNQWQHSSDVPLNEAALRFRSLNTDEKGSLAILMPPQDSIIDSLKLVAYAVDGKDLSSPVLPTSESAKIIFSGSAAPLGYNPFFTAGALVGQRAFDLRRLPKWELFDFDAQRLILKPILDETGRWLIARFADKNTTKQVFRIWDLKREIGSSDKQIFPVPTHSTALGGSFPEGVTEAKLIAYHPWILTRGSDNTIRRDNLLDNKFDQLSGPDGAQIVALSQKERWVAASGKDGSIQVWNLQDVDSTSRRLKLDRMSIGEIKAEAMEVVGRNLTKGELTRVEGALDENAPLSLVLPHIVESQPKQVYVGKLKGIDPNVVIFDVKDTLADQGNRIEGKTVKEFGIRLNRGKTYVVDMISEQIDSYLILKDVNSSELARNDDGGGALNARIQFASGTNDEFLILATTFAGGQFGNFRLTVTEVKTIPAADVRKIKAGLTEYSGELSENNFATPDGPGLVYELIFPDKGICQLELKSAAFNPMLRLEDVSGQKLADARKIGEGARLVFNAEATAHRVVIIGTQGKAGPFDLQVDFQPTGK